MRRNRAEKNDDRKQRKVGWKISCAGSATIEAACLMPMVLGVIFLTIYLCVFAYNRAAAVSLAGRCIVEAAGMEQEGASVIESKVTGALQHGLNAMPMVSSSGKVSASLLTVKVTAGFDQSMGVRLLSGLPKGMQFETSQIVTRLDPAKYLWTLKIAKEAMSGRGNVPATEPEVMDRS